MTRKIVRMRPFIPDYGIEVSDEGLMEWDFVEEEMTKSKFYWLSTTTKKGNPHAIPIWGIYYNGLFFYGGGPDTKNRKNLQFNPNIVVHTESGADVVIMEGTVSVEKDDVINDKIVELYKQKYNLDHPKPFYRVDPIKAFAWRSENYAKTPTKWLIED